MDLYCNHYLSKVHLNDLFYLTECTNVCNYADDTTFPGPLKQGQRGSQAPPQNKQIKTSLLMCLFLLRISLNVLFLKEVTNNVHENQRAKSRTG